jgi:hypothetical protein
MELNRHQFQDTVNTSRQSPENKSSHYGSAAVEGGVLRITMAGRFLDYAEGSLCSYHHRHGSVSSFTN